MKHSFLPGNRLKYHSCLFTSVSLDAEWTRRSHVDGASSPETAIEDAFQAISYRCKKYKGRIIDHRRDQGFEDPAGTNQKLWGCMFNPLEYIPMGHDDALSLVLFDDFDPFVGVTGQCATTVEEMAVGYLPDLHSLIQDWTNVDESITAAAKHAIGDLETLFAPGSAADRPSLLVFSRFKVNSLSSLGMGSLHQAALMRAIVRCIGESLKHLKEGICEKSSHKRLLDAFEIGSDDLEKTRFVLVDLLGQEELGLVYFTSNWSVAAAINSRIQCLKFSEVIAADNSKCLEEEYQASDWFQQLAAFYSDIEGIEAETPESLYSKIQDTHPLRWTRSTAAVKKEVFYACQQQPDQQVVNGWIDAITHLRIAPGHQSKAQDLTGVIIKPFTGTPSEAGADPAEGRERKTISDVQEHEFRIHQLGASDLALPHREFTPSDPHRLVSTKEFLVRIYSLMKVAGHVDKDQALESLQVGRQTQAEETAHGLLPTEVQTTRPGRQTHGRHIVGATTFCGIPVPILKDSNGHQFLSPAFDIGRHIAILEVILPVLKRRIMLSKEKEPAGETWSSEVTKAAIMPGHVPGELWGALSPAHICTPARQYGLPQTLIRTLEFVFHNFTTLLANPFAFDSVLDLYDVFTSFHRVLTTELPKITKEGPLDERRIGMIAKLIDAVHRSLEHRMYRLFPENSNRDMDIDFRGGLNALVYSADGVLKLGVGVLRHHMLSDDAGNDRARVGVVTRIGFRQGISAVALRLGIESEARLGIVETDVPHLYHLPSYVDFLHEAFHLLYDAARNPAFADDPHPMLPTIPRGSSEQMIDGRLAEIFANLLTALFVCPDDPNWLAEHMIIQYATSSRGMRELDPEIVGNLIEHCIHLFVVCRCLTSLKESMDPGRREEIPWWYCEGHDGDKNRSEDAFIERLNISDDAEKFAEDFHAFFFELLPFFSEKLALQPEGTEALKQYLEQQVGTLFREIYEERLKPFVPIVFAKVCLIYSRYWFRAAGKLIDPGEYRQLKRLRPGGVPEVEIRKLWLEWINVHDDLNSEMQRIISQKQFEPFSFLAWRPSNEGGKGRLDPMIVLGVVLGQILKDRSRDLSGDDGPFHLPTTDGRPSFKVSEWDPDRAKKLERYARKRVFIQRGVNALFSGDLDYRAHRLGSRITVLKMFGDMSSLLRSKRLSEMLFRNMSAKS